MRLKMILIMIDYAGQPRGSQMYLTIPITCSLKMSCQYLIKRCLETQWKLPPRELILLMKGGGMSYRKEV